MFVHWQQAALTPVEETAKGDLRICADVYLIFVGPDMHTDQHHTDANGAIQLAEKCHVSTERKVGIPRQIVCLLSCSGIKSLLFCGLMVRSFWLYSFSVQRGQCDGDSVWENIHLRCEDSQFKFAFHRTFPSF